MNMKYNFDIDMSTNYSFPLILRRITPGSRVLEFGPATGYMTRYMKEELGCSVYCVEIDRKAAEAAKNYCEKMVVEDIDNMEWVEQLSEDSFDHIIFADVLEHLKNPWKVLEYAVAFLKKNGTVITSIPNIGHNAVIMDLLQGKFDYRPRGLLDDTHLRFFTKKSILNLLEKTKLCPIEWLVTITHPEETEFQQKYTTLPEPLERILKTREDAHVYQFVTVSKRKEDISPKECCIELNTTDTDLGNGVLQVFWEVNGEFNEEHSVLCSFEYDKDFCSYDITLPPQVSSRLRLDTGNKPAYVEIKSIALYIGDLDRSEMVEPLAKWSVDNDFVNLLAGSGVVRLDYRESYRFISTDDDPQLYLDNIPLSKDGEPFTLRVEMRIEKRISHCFTKVLEAEINNREKQLSQQTNELARLQAELKGKDERLSLQADELAGLQAEIKAKDGQLSCQAAELARLLADITAKDGELSCQVDELAEKQEILSGLEVKLNEILSSRSWKITEPLRQLRHLMGGNKEPERKK